MTSIVFSADGFASMHSRREIFAGDQIQLIGIEAGVFDPNQSLQS
jgi:hypothetical protein